MTTLWTRVPNDGLMIGWAVAGLMHAWVCPVHLIPYVSMYVPEPAFPRRPGFVPHVVLLHYVSRRALQDEDATSGHLGHCC